MPTQEQMDAAVEQLTQITQQVNDGNDALNLINLRTEEAQANVDALNAKTIETQERLSQVEGELDAATSTKALRVGELADLQLKLSAAQSDLQAALTAVNKAKADGEDVVRDATEAHAKVIADAQTKVDQLTAQADDLQKQIAPTAEQVGRLQAQVDTLNSQIIALEQKIQDGQLILDDITARTDAAVAALNDSKTLAGNLDADIEAKKAEQSSLVTDLDDKRAQLTEATDKLVALNAEIAKNSLLNDDFLIARADVEKSKKDYAALFDTLKQKYGDLKEPWPM
jgi:chromosome segregation ATPase